MRDLLQLDYWVLRHINVEWAHPSLDQFWLTITHLEKHAWFVFLILPLLLARMFYIYRWQAFKPLAMLGLTVGLSDAFAFRLIKHFVQRPRPFENPEIADWLRHIGDAHGPSFPSNHATNCFAGAAILSWYFPRLSKYFYIFAGLVAYSRMVLGVHYPSDVLAGVILGSTVGFLVRTLILNGRPALRLHPRVSESNRTFVRD